MAATCARCASPKNTRLLPRRKRAAHGGPVTTASRSESHRQGGLDTRPPEDLGGTAFASTIRLEPCRTRARRRVDATAQGGRRVGSLASGALRRATQYGFIRCDTAVRAAADIGRRVRPAAVAAVRAAPARRARAARSSFTARASAAMWRSRLARSVRSCCHAVCHVSLLSAMHALPFPSQADTDATRRRARISTAGLFAPIRMFGRRSTREGSGRPVAGMPPPYGPADETPVGERRCPWRTGTREFHVAVEQQHVNQRGNQPRVPVGIGLLVLPRHCQVEAAGGRVDR